MKLQKILSLLLALCLLAGLTACGSKPAEPAPAPTEAPAEGCGSALGMSALAILMAAAAVVALKKKA